MFVRYVIGLLAAIILFPFVAGCETTLTMVLGPVEREIVAFESLDTGGRSNKYLVCPKDYCAAPPDRSSPVFAESATALKTRWMAMIAAQPRITPGRADERSLQYDFVQRSRIMRFPDTITVRFIPLGEDKSTLAIYSRSHYGRSDFGVNRDRIEAWLAALAV